MCLQHITEHRFCGHTISQTLNCDAYLRNTLAHAVFCLSYKCESTKLEGTCPDGYCRHWLMERMNEEMSARAEYITAQNESLGHPDVIQNLIEKIDEDFTKDVQYHMALQEYDSRPTPAVYVGADSMQPLQGQRNFETGYMDAPQLPRSAFLPNSLQVSPMKEWHSARHTAYSKPYQTRHMREYLSARYDFLPTILQTAFLMEKHTALHNTLVAQRATDLPVFDSAFGAGSMATTIDDPQWAPFSTESSVFDGSPIARRPSSFASALHKAGLRNDPSDSYMPVSEPQVGKRKAVEATITTIKTDETDGHRLTAVSDTKRRRLVA